MKAVAVAVALGVLIGAGLFLLLDPLDDRCENASMWIDGVPDPAASVSDEVALAAFLADGAERTPAAGFQPVDFSRTVAEGHAMTFQADEGRLNVTLEESLSSEHPGWHVTKVDRSCNRKKANTGL